MKADTTNAEETRSDLRKAVSWIGALLIVLPIIYILSMGPATKLVDFHVITISAWKTFYSPLAPVCSRCEPFRDFLMWYIFDVWRNPYPPLKP